jgi:PEP-CTERM motif
MRQHRIFRGFAMESKLRKEQRDAVRPKSLPHSLYNILIGGNVSRKALSKIAVVLFSALLLTAVAQADTIHSSFGFLLGTGDFYNGSGPFVQCQGYNSSCSQSGSQTTTGTYHSFDSSLGTLNGVTITLTSTFPLGMELLSFGGHSSLSGYSDYNIGDIFTGTINAQGYTCDGFCDTYPPNGTIDNVLNAAYVVPAAQLASYIGMGGALNMNIFQSLTLNGTSENSYTFRIRTNELFTQGWRGTVDLAYDYTPNAALPVPEPSSAMLMIGGLGTLAGAIRRKLNR